MVSIDKEHLIGNMTNQHSESTPGLIGRLSLDTDSSESDVDGAHSEQNTEILYRLSEITSPEQYIGSEHIIEFWPIYRQLALAANRNIGPQYNIDLIIDCLINPQPRNIPYASDNQKAEYAKELGLVVSTRKEVGFSPSFRTKRQISSGVIQAGSLINFIHKNEQAYLAEKDQRPKNFNKFELQFLSALVSHLERQIEQ